MNNKLSGIIFLLFGIGLFSDSVYGLYQNSISMEAKSLKSIFLAFLGVSSCIYGYKQINKKKNHQSKTD